MEILPVEEGICTGKKRIGEKRAGMGLSGNYSVFFGREA